MATPREMEMIREILHPVRNPTIVELGAHTGEDESWIRATCSAAAHYVMVEPEMRNLQFIIDRAGPLGPTTNRRLILGAVAAADGMVVFHTSYNERTKDMGSGSIRRPTGHVSGMPWVKFPHDTVVPGYSLDSIFHREWLTKIDLLWVDIQGAERDMITGGQRALRHTRYVFLEAETEELYEGEALKPELIRLLPGWELIEDFGSNILLRNSQFVLSEARFR